MTVWSINVIPFFHVEQKNQINATRYRGPFKIFLAESKSSPCSTISACRTIDRSERSFFADAIFNFSGGSWRWTREEKGSGRLTTCRVRMSYFDIGTSYPIRSAWRLFWKRGRTIPWQYSDRWSRSTSLSSLYVVMVPRLPSPFLYFFLACSFPQCPWRAGKLITHLPDSILIYARIYISFFFKFNDKVAAEFRNRKHSSINVPL